MMFKRNPRTKRMVGAASVLAIGLTFVGIQSASAWTTTEAKFLTSQ